MTDVDVVVVGAGLAGLTAAREAQRAGATALVLEARDRVGGRTYSVDARGVRIDLGAQWLGPTQARMADLVAEFGIETFPTHHDGKKVLEVEGSVSTYSGTIPHLSPRKLASLNAAIKRIEKMSRRVDVDAPWTADDAGALDALNAGSLKSSIRSPAVRGIVDCALRVVFGAEPAEVSLLWFLFYLRSGGGLISLVEIEGGAQETRFVAGAQSVALALATEVEVERGSPVRAVEQDADGVTVVGATNEVRAKRAIVAVPQSLGARIHFDPAVPQARDALLQRFPMGATTKIHLLYERAFWRERGLSGEAVVAEGPVDVVFDNSSRDAAQPALLVFACGDNARRLAALSAVERRATVVDAVVRCFGPEAREAIDYIEKDWADDPWTRGCPTGFVAPGALSVLGPALRTRFGRVHWAGSETSTEWAGYMEGAVASGERAAAEVVAEL